MGPSCIQAIVEKEKANIWHFTVLNIFNSGSDYPCQGQLYALRGYDGHPLWKLNVASNFIINMNCVDFDINGDGYRDCILTGRMGLVQAVNVLKGMAKAHIISLLELTFEFN